MITCPAPTGGGNWNKRAPDYYPRLVTLSYPDSAFPGADAAGCNFAATVTNSVTATVNYLDPARTTLTTPAASQSYQIACSTPFAQAVNGGRDVQNNDGTMPDGTTRIEWVPPDTTGFSCPASGRDQWGRACTPGGSLARYRPSPVAGHHRP